MKILPSWPVMNVRFYLLEKPHGKGMNGPQPPGPIGQAFEQQVKKTVKFSVRNNVSPSDWLKLFRPDWFESLSVKFIIEFSIINYNWSDWFQNLFRTLSLTLQLLLQKLINNTFQSLYTSTVDFTELV